MADFPTLEVLLHHEPIGLLTHLPGDRNLFTFTETYIDSKSRPTLGLSFLDDVDQLITDPQQSRTRLPPFFCQFASGGPYARIFGSASRSS